MRLERMLSVSQRQESTDKHRLPYLPLIRSTSPSHRYVRDIITERALKLET